MTRSKCHVCGATFNVQRHEMRYLGTGDIKNAQYEFPVSYLDWQAHIMLTCPVHRLPRMPDSCLIDLERLIAAEKRRSLIDQHIESQYQDSESDVVE